MATHRIHERAEGGAALCRPQQGGSEHDAQVGGRHVVGAGAAADALQVVHQEGQRGVVRTRQPLHHQLQLADSRGHVTVVGRVVLGDPARSQTPPV